MQTFDFGSGPELVVAGDFTALGGRSMKHVMRWHAGAWEQLGLGFAGPVYALEVYDDGAGPKLYAGGGITSSGPTTMLFPARWNAVAWAAFPHPFTFTT